MSDPRQPPRIGVGTGGESTDPIGQTDPTPSPGDMQFEQFEPAAPTAPPSADASADAAAAAAPAVASCAACQQPITEAYYEAGGQVFCPRCRENYQAEQTGGSRVGRMLRALVFGTLAGLGGTIIWFGVRKLTGYEVGLIAIVVGLMVGGAVRAGSRGRGGVFYQLLAVFITYSAIVANYVPDVFEMMMKEFGDDKAAAVASATQPTSQPGAAATAPSGGVESAAASPGDEQEVGAGRAIVGIILLSLIAFAFAFVMPVLAGFENIIGLLIIGFALWEAWKINKRVVVEFTGPYALAGGTAPPSPPPIPGAGTV